VSFHLNQFLSYVQRQPVLECYLLSDFPMRIAIAHWTGRISPVFDVSDHLLLIDIEGRQEQRREDIKLMSDNPLERAKELSELGVEILICGSISNIMKVTHDLSLI